MLNFKKPNPFYIAFYTSVIFLTVFYVLGLSGLINSSDTSLIGEASRWCERVSDGAFREPVNTLSNLGFMVVGLYIFWVISNEDISSNNKFIGLTPISILYASAAWWLGPGSMLMHGTNTEWGGWADNLSMIMYIIFPWLYNVSLMGRWSAPRLIKVYFSIVL
ncbi:ceramidase domain-containing protein, partial [Gammaproteobacteria bacterium]|nr:ceramidase domain-containing protein [Gammaproteobacteria bacterium]